MIRPREGTPRRRPAGRRLERWAGLALLGVAPLVGCQAEYAGMTLPSGKYMYDDVQYFQPGPEFPWANTQAATQRARMLQMGLDVPDSLPTGPLGGAPPAAGALAPVQNTPNMPTNPNVMQIPQDEMGPNVPPPPVPGAPPGPADMPSEPGGVTEPEPGGNINNLPR